MWCAGRGGAFLCANGRGESGVVRGGVLVQACPPPGGALLPLRAAEAEAFRQAVGAGDPQACGHRLLSSSSSASSLQMILLYVFASLYSCMAYIKGVFCGVLIGASYAVPALQNHTISTPSQRRLVWVQSMLVGWVPICLIA